MQTENIKLKMENFKLISNFNTLKVDYLKVESDNTKILSLLEQILSKSGVKVETIKLLIESLSFDLNINDNLSNMNQSSQEFHSSLKEKEKYKFEFSPNNKKKLIDLYVNSHIKNQIYSMRNQNSSLMEEINELKSSERIINFNKIRDNFHKKCKELTQLKNTYIKLKMNFEENEDLIHNLKEERNDLANAVSKLKTQISLLSSSNSKSKKKLPLINENHNLKNKPTNNNSFGNKNNDIDYKAIIDNFMSINNDQENSIKVLKNEVNRLKNTLKNKEVSENKLEEEFMLTDETNKNKINDLKSQIKRLENELEIIKKDKENLEKEILLNTQSNIKTDQDNFIKNVNIKSEPNIGVGVENEFSVASKEKKSMSHFDERNNHAENNFNKNKKQINDESNKNSIDINHSELKKKNTNNEFNFENDRTKDVKFDNNIKEKELNDQITALKLELNKVIQENKGKYLLLRKCYV